MTQIRIYFVITLIYLCSLQITPGATLNEAAEQADNTVEITFYLLRESKWPDKESDFKASVANVMNTYCQPNYLECGLTTWVETYEFTSDDISVTEVEYLKDNLHIKFYVGFNQDVPGSSRNKTSYVVNQQAVQGGIEEARADVYEAMGYYVVGIGQDVYTPPIDHFLNKVIIPIACGLLLVLIIVTIALFYWRNKKNKEAEKIQKRIKHRENRSKKPKEDKGSTGYPKPSQRVGPAPHTDLEMGRRQNLHSGKSAKSESDFTDGIVQKPLKTSTFTAGFNAGKYKIQSELSHDDNHAVDSHVSMRDNGNRNNSLPPLDDGRDESRRKHRKHKKHRKDSHKHGQDDDDDRHAAPNIYNITPSKVTATFQAPGHSNYNGAQSEQAQRYGNAHFESDSDNHEPPVIYKY